MEKDTIGILNKNEQMENSLQRIEALQSYMTIFFVKLKLVIKLALKF